MKNGNLTFQGLKDIAAAIRELKPSGVTDYISTGSNVLVAAATIFVAIQGYISLKAWRSQMIYKRKAELAEEIIADFYEAREIINWVRLPASFWGEEEKRQGRDQETPCERTYRDKYYIPLKRLADNAEFFSKIRARRYRIIALFGNEATKEYDELKEIYNKIHATASTFLALSANDEYKNEEMEKTLFSIDKNDPIGLKLKDILNRIESRYRKVITDE